MSDTETEKFPTKTQQYICCCVVIFLIIVFGFIWSGQPGNCTCGGTGAIAPEDEDDFETQPYQWPFLRSIGLVN